MNAFVQGRAWGVMKRYPGLSAIEIAKRLRMPEHALRRCLSRMKAAGYARREGGHHHVVWFAVGERPYDQRGLPANSYANMVPCQRNWPQFIRMANIAKGLDPDKMTTPRPKIPAPVLELERCWQSAISRTQDEDIAA